MFVFVRTEKPRPMLLHQMESVPNDGYSDYNKPWQKALLAHYREDWDLSRPVDDEIYETALARSDDASVPSDSPSELSPLRPLRLRRSQRVNVLRHRPHPQTGLPAPSQVYETASMYDSSGDNGIVGGELSLRELFHVQLLLDRYTGCSVSKKTENARYILEHERLPGAPTHLPIWYYSSTVYNAAIRNLIDMDEWNGSWSDTPRGPTREGLAKIQTELNMRRLRAIVACKTRARALRVAAAKRVYSPDSAGALNAAKRFKQSCENQ